MFQKMYVGSECENNLKKVGTRKVRVSVGIITKFGKYFL